MSLLPRFFYFLVMTLPNPASIPTAPRDERWLFPFIHVSFLLYQLTPVFFPETLPAA